MSRIASSSEANINVHIIDEKVLHHEKLYEDSDSEESQEKWYLINPKKTIPMIWDFLMNLFTIYSLVATPLV
jgi:hypothetical protein